MYLNKGLGSFPQANKDTNKTLRLIYLMIQNLQGKITNPRDIFNQNNIVNENPTELH